MKLFASILLLSTAAFAQNQPSILGHWQGEIVNLGQPVPVYLDITGTPTDLKAVLVNGTGGTPASSASFKDGHLVVSFDYFARAVDATLADGKLTGTFGGPRKGYVPITLHPAPIRKASTPARTELLGDWEIATKSTKNESAWTLHLVTSDAPQFTVRAVIQRIDGDTGALYGSWEGDNLRLSRVTAAGIEFYSIQSQPNGTLLFTDLTAAKPVTVVARRPNEARKENLAPPTETTQQTTMKDPNARFAFSAADLSGKLVSNTDPQFDGKVIIVAIGGSWCPNCHDEAPFLESLYKQFHAQGLEIVNLSFEEEAQLKNPTRLHAFIDRYGLTYNVLLAGTTDQLNEKIPQADNLDCWPTAFFIGRDGRVKEIHAGYAGPGNPTANKALIQEVTGLVETLLAEPVPVQSASARP